MTFDDIALDQRGMARPELTRHPEARAGCRVPFVKDDGLEAVLPQVLDPLLTASAVRVLPDLHRRFLAALHPLGRTCENACHGEQNEATTWRYLPIKGCGEFHGGLMPGLAKRKS
jgi:hypothetical protein